MESMSGQAWLRCTITPGQFSDEYAVSAVDHRGAGFSLFAPGSSIRFKSAPVLNEGPIDGEIRVAILDRKDALRLVRLPARTMENGDSITVLASQLLPDSEYAVA